MRATCHDLVGVAHDDQLHGIRSIAGADHLSCQAVNLRKSFGGTIVNADHGCLPRAIVPPWLHNTEGHLEAIIALSCCFLACIEGLALCSSSHC